MMTLREWLAPWADIATHIEVQGLSLSSQDIKQGDVFIAVNGAKQHGLAYASQALAQGAVAVLFDSQDHSLAEDSLAPCKQPVIGIAHLATHLGDMAARFYHHPSQTMAVIGITGTNGKTSCSQFLSQLLTHCAFIGTLGWGTPTQLHKTLNTTPDALTIQKILAQLKTAQTGVVAMEVSSHGIAQGRIHGVTFQGAVFTNLSRDHLDYHGSMEAYLETKLHLFRTPSLEFAVVNLDDEASGHVINALDLRVKLIGVSATGQHSPRGDTLIAQSIRLTLDGITCDMQWQGKVLAVHIPLMGRFNIENVLCSLAVMLALGVDFAHAVEKAAQLQGVDGRMKRLGGQHGKPLVIIDYAHTPDALEKALTSLRKHTQGRLWVVFGCGGNRDSGKRAQMGRIAEQYADHVILTDDNPRFESAQRIIDDIASGCVLQKQDVIHDRAQAIQSAIAQASVADCILIAGKGHETYQEIEGVQYPFSDTQCVTDIMSAL